MFLYNLYITAAY